MPFSIGFSIDNSFEIGLIDPFCVTTHRKTYVQLLADVLAGADDDLFILLINRQGYARNLFGARRDVYLIKDLCCTAATRARAVNLFYHTWL
jgi:hypothetical protein